MVAASSALRPPTPPPPKADPLSIAHDDRPPASRDASNRNTAGLLPQQLYSRLDGEVRGSQSFAAPRHRGNRLCWQLKAELTFSKGKSGGGRRGGVGATVNARTIAADNAVARIVRVSSSNRLFRRARIAMSRGGNRSGKAGRESLPGRRRQ